MFKAPLNASRVLQLNDTLPSGVDVDSTSLGGSSQYYYCMILSTDNIFEQPFSMITALRIASRAIQWEQRVRII